MGSAIEVDSGVVVEVLVREEDSGVGMVGIVEVVRHTTPYDAFLGSDLIW